MEINDKSRKSCIEDYFSPYRLLIIFMFVLGVVSWYSYLLIIENNWCFGTCTYEIDIGILAPFRMLAAGLSSTLLLFLFFPIRYFKRWFFYFASWMVPLGFVFVFTVPMYGGGFLSMPQRELGAFLLSYYFFIGTAILVSLFTLYDIWHWYRTKKHNG